MAMDLHEECGVFGVISPERAAVADLAYYGLYALPAAPGAGKLRDCN